MGFLMFCWLMLGVVCALIAAAKGRSGLGWFILGCLFGPLALLFAAVMSPDKTREESFLRACPYCAEKVQMEAVLCKHCQQSLEKAKPRNADAWRQN